jgi:hypothetical protein
MKNLSLLTLLTILFVSCAPGPTPAPASGATDTLLSTATLTPEPTGTFTLTATETPSPTNTPRPTKTPIPRYPLSFVFPNTSSGQSIWSNADPGAWINIDNDYVIHFDVLAPSKNFDRNSCVLSPVEGVVNLIFISGEPGRSEGQVMAIDLEYLPEGIENIFSPDFRNEITYLSHNNKYSFQYEIDDIKKVGVSIGHIWVSKNIVKGTSVSIGDCIGTVDYDAWFLQDKIAYVLYIYMKDGKMFQFSPCSVENLDPFCGKCAPNSHFRCKSNE